MAKNGIKKLIAPKKKEETRTLHIAQYMFLAYKDSEGVSPKTFRSYGQSIDYFIDFLKVGMHFEDPDELPIELIDNNMVMSWRSWMVHKGKTYTTINHYLRDLRAFLYWCMDDERKYISNPYKIKLVKGQEPKMKLFDDDDLELLLRKPDDSATFAEWRTWAMINWALGTGNRAGTMRNIKVEDINWETKQVFLRHNKDKKYHTTSMSKATEEAITDYMNTWHITEWLFPCGNNPEQQLSENACTHAFSRYCKARGASHSGMHGLRHTFGSKMADSGANAFVIQEALGHSTITMAEKYVRHDKDNLKNQFRLYNPLDSVKRKKTK